MLVLTRKLRESVIVGGGASAHRELTVTVLEIHGDRVRLGIEAHHDVKVHRWEVWERIRQATIAVTATHCDPGLPSRHLLNVRSEQ